MKKSTTKRKTLYPAGSWQAREVKLRIARAQLRAVTAAVGQFTTPQVEYRHVAPSEAGVMLDGPAKFVHLCPVYGRPVMQALDEAGQVWESVFRKATPTTPEERWWEPISMERREKKAEEVPAS